MKRDYVNDLKYLLNFRTNYFIYDELASGELNLRGVVADKVIAESAERGGYYVVRTEALVSYRR